MKSNTLINEQAGKITSARLMSLQHSDMINHGLLTSPECNIDVQIATNTGTIKTDLQNNINIHEKFVQHGELHSTKLNLYGSGELLNHSQIHATDSLSIKDIKLVNHNDIVAAQLEITNKEVVNHSKIMSTQSTLINTDNLINKHTGTLCAENTLTIKVKGNCANEGTTSGKDINIKSNSLQQNGQLQSNNNTHIEVEHNIDHTGVAQATGSHNIISKQGDLNHQSGSIAANKTISLTAKTYHLDAEVISQEGEIIFSGGNLENNSKISGEKIKGNIDTVHNKGKCMARKGFDLSAVTITNDGQLSSENETLLLTAKKYIRQNKEIHAKSASLSAETIINNGDMTVKEEVVFATSHQMTNNKNITSENGLISLKGDGEINQSGSLSAKDITIRLQRRVIKRFFST